MVTAHDQAASPNPQPSSAQLICVMGAKGGVGTTTVAVNLAVSLRQRFSSPVLLLDWDFAGGTAAPLLGVTARYSLRDLLGRPSECDSYLFLRSLSESSCGVCVLPNGYEGWQQAVGSPAQLAHMARLAVQTHSLIVADIGRASGEHAAPILNRATTVVLVSTPNVEAMLRAGRIVWMVDSSPLQATRRLFVVNCTRGADRPVLEEAQRQLRRQIDLMIPRDDNHVTLAAERGRPVVTTAPSGPFSRTIRDLERLVLGTDGDKTIPSESSWFHQLSSWFPRRKAA